MSLQKQAITTTAIRIATADIRDGRCILTQSFPLQMEKTAVMESVMPNFGSTWIFEDRGFCGSLYYSLTDIFNFSIC
jgi:hypothetical protein